MNYKYEMSQNARKWSLGMIALGLVLIIMHVLFSHDGEDNYHRLWANILLNASWFTGICIAGIFFVAVHNIAMSAWQTVIKRIPEVFFNFLPITALILIMVFSFGMDIFHWSHEGIGEFTEGKEDSFDHIISDKAGYLNQTAITFRTLIYFFGWITLAYLIRKNSLNEDIQGGVKWYRNSIVISYCCCF